MTLLAVMLPKKDNSLKTRQAGSHKFISVHILVPANWTVQRGHDLLDLLEADIEKTLHGIMC